ncbi:MAG: pyridoxamine 5'-phosphate oxidase family protein [Lachnospiraceae bacterium]|nr:pyridoxamine 5'-phosphate oxidase family protein [Lachnospiraceae bacterium]
MRRSDREVTEFEDMIAIIKECDVCRLALNNGEYPYILPLNFGLAVVDNRIELYFHGALEGTKYELMEKDNRASFEMDCSHKLVTQEDTGNCTMAYKSVIGQGYIEMIPEEKKYNALCILMKQYHKEEFAFNKAVMPQTKVFKLVVEHMTGKERIVKE